MARISRRWRLIALAAVGALLLALFAWRGRAGAPAVPVAPRPVAPLAGAAAVKQQARLPPPDPAARRKALIDQMQLTEHTYCSYRDATVYPHGARPIAEQPDQIWPNTPVTELNPMRQEGGDSDPTIQIQTSQSRVHMAAGDSVSLSLRALDEQGTPLPLVVTAAQAQGMTFRDERPGPQVTLHFSQDGPAQGSAQAGLHTAVLTPSQTALAAFDGTIRTRVRYSVAGKSGAVLFDVVYSPETPAVWTGQVREAIEDGSLVFYLQVDVRRAGRFVVNGRVDDARGTPLALLTFNDLLPAGPGEIKLTMFGKLVRDHRPAMPLTLRDVDGYLLRENQDPDRLTMARLAGEVHVSRSHPLNRFSDAEWQSQERTRYLHELGMDMHRARAALIQFDPAAPLAPPCKAP